MWTRRSFAGCALAAVAPAATAAPHATPLLPTGGPSFQLGPAAGQDWALHRSDPAPRLVQLPAGVQLVAGPIGAVDRNGLALWSRTWWTQGAFQATFQTRKLDASSARGPQTLYLLLYFGVQGDGTPGHPPRLSDWPGDTVPYTHAYADHIRGARISLYRQFPDDNGETQTLEAACFKADGSRNAFAGDTPVAFPGARNAVYGWTVRRVGGRVIVSQNDRGTVRTVTFTDPAFGQYAAAGSFGLLVSPGRAVEVDGFAVTGA